MYYRGMIPGEPFYSRRRQSTKMRPFSCLPFDGISACYTWDSVSMHCTRNPDEDSFNGDSGEIRTRDILRDSQVLYPAELRNHILARTLLAAAAFTRWLFAVHIGAWDFPHCVCRRRLPRILLFLRKIWIKPRIIQTPLPTVHHI